MSYNVYRKLQQHLDAQPVGFPATKTGSDIRVLKHIFSQEQAKVATCLSYRPEPIENIFDKAQTIIHSIQELKDFLFKMEKKGGIEIRLNNGTPLYCNAPLIVGMYEFQLARLTPDFINDLGEYTSDRKFGINFLSSKISQMRTIPIKKSINIKNHVSTYDEGFSILKESKGPFAICECICRKKKSLQGLNCKTTQRKETCLGIGELALAAVRIGMGRPIELEEAIQILEDNQKDGLVMQPSNTRDVDFICSCCGCCCGMLGMQKGLPRPLEFWTSNHYVELDSSLCVGCGICAKRCQVDALTLFEIDRSESEKKIRLDLDRCIGCGQCVPVCAKKALQLKKKPNEVIPPETREDLYDTLMEHKKGKIGKMKLTGKLVYAAIRKGQLKKLIAD